MKGWRRPAGKEDGDGDRVPPRDWSQADAPFASMTSFIRDCILAIEAQRAQILFDTRQWYLTSVLVLDMVDELLDHQFLFLML